MAETNKVRPTTNTIKGRRGRKPTEAITPAKPPMTKRDRLRARLEETGGASLTQLGQEFGWQPHTVRAAISGLRKAGLEVQRETGNASSVYRIVSSKAAA